MYAAVLCDDKLFLSLHNQSLYSELSGHSRYSDWLWRIGNNLMKWKEGTKVQEMREFRWLKLVLMGEGGLFLSMYNVKFTYFLETWQKKLQTLLNESINYMSQSWALITIHGTQPSGNWWGGKYWIPPYLSSNKFSCFKIVLFEQWPVIFTTDLMCIASFLCKYDYGGNLKA